MSDERRYSEAELHAIFERAAKRQEEADRADAASRGQLTLAELQEIGAASGIDPAHVAAAAGDLAAVPPPKRVLGLPAEVRRSRAVPSVSDEEWERMVDALRATFGGPGAAGQVGRRREWTLSKASGKNTSTTIHVTLEPEAAPGGGNRLTVVQPMKEVAMVPAILGGTMGGTAALMAAVALLSTSGDPLPWPVVAVFCVLALVMGVGGYFWVAAYARKQEQKFEAVLDRLDLLARSDTPAPPVSAPSDRLDLDALPDVDERSGSGSRNRMRS